MYEYLDRPVGGLAEADRFMLAAVRGWVAARRTGKCPCAALVNGFRSRRVEIALGDFSQAMAILDIDGLEQLRFMPVCAGVVGDDEARLLALLSLARTGPAERLRGAAAALVHDHAVVPLIEAVDFVGVAMATPES